MLIRALIVLLIALNLGAAAWWISRPPQSLPPAPPQPQGVARLQLLSEHVASAQAVAVPGPAALVASVAPAPQAALTPKSAETSAETSASTSSATPLTAGATPAAAATVVTTAVPAATARQCFSLGPFTNAAAAQAAGSRLGASSLHAQAREVPGKAASGYNVSLPPSADRPAAQALAQRIGSAGFNDFLVINTGEQTNGIALGRYGSRDAAERRQATLKAAGFPAQVTAVGNEGTSQWWLDVTAAQGIDAAALKTTTAAAQSRSRDCAALR